MRVQNEKPKKNEYKKKCLNGRINGEVYFVLLISNSFLLFFPKIKEEREKKFQ